MSEQVIILEKRANYAVLTINRPPYNPLNGQVFTELGKALTELEADQEMKALIITGSGAKAFAAGADVTEVASHSPLEQYDFLRLILSVFDQLENLRMPTIAAVNGRALGGGCELTLACDFRLAAENAKFGQPEISLGIMPGGGGTQRLTRLIGLSRAKELVLLGDAIDAATAEKYGLVNRVVPSAELMAEAEKMAAKLASKPVVATQVIKKVVNMGQQLDLDVALNLEINSFIVTFTSKDGQEGLKAFLEKRKPEFQGK
jgi:enoyl-CoA hydratase